MTYLIAYFELKNKRSANYAGFADVGNYDLPRKIYGGNISVNYDGKIIKSSIITDFSGQSANYYFARKGADARDLLINFIQGRMLNECVVSCLVGYINVDQDIVFAERKIAMTIPELRRAFAGEPHVGTCIEIIC